MLLEELWNVSQEELDFLTEAHHTKQFQENNKDIQYVSCPLIEDSLTTSKVLTMEYIDGFSIGNLERIPEGEYNVDEIDSKLTENYIKQVIDDGFFHAGKGNADNRRRSGKYITRY